MPWNMWVMNTIPGSGGQPASRTLGREPAARERNALEQCYLPREHGHHPSDAQREFSDEEGARIFPLPSQWARALARAGRVREQRDRWRATAQAVTVLPASMPAQRPVTNAVARLPR